MRLERLHKKNLDVTKEAIVQAEEVAVEITRKLEKQEKKHWKETASCNCPPVIRKQQLCGKGV